MMPEPFQKEYQDFLRRTGFENPQPQALLMELASLSMEVYLKDIAWLTDFLGRLEKGRQSAA